VEPNPINPMTERAEPTGTSSAMSPIAKAKYLAHIPGWKGKYEGGGAQWSGLRTARRAEADASVYMCAFGGEGHEIWNVANPP